jgi:hypothetical protein
LRRLSVKGLLVRVARRAKGLVERPQALRQDRRELKQFDRGNSNLRVVYCHYFAPDPNPEEVWAIDETVHGSPSRRGKSHWKPASFLFPAKTNAAVCIFGDDAASELIGRRETNVGFALLLTSAYGTG